MKIEERLALETLKSAYASGRSVAQIARGFDVSPEGVRRLMKRYGIPARPRGPQPRATLSSQVHDADGYVLIRAATHPDAVNGYVREQRLVMEGMILRRLTKDEVVLHKNGIRDDNRPSNLQLFDTKSMLASHSLQGNSHARGDFGNPKRSVRKKRTPWQMLRGVAELAAILDRPIRRSDLEPPYPSHRALTRAFGSWWYAVELSQRKDVRSDPTLVTLFARYKGPHWEEPRVHTPEPPNPHKPWDGDGDSKAA